MRFEPPRCPYTECAFHVAPEGRFYILLGHYQPKCRRHPVPRFRCKGCGRRFSQQTFRADYRDRKPHTNVQALEMLVSGSGLRQIGRTVGLDIHSVQGKLKKYGRHSERLHDNLSPRLPPGRTFVLDEEETYEKKSIRPLTVPLLIDHETWFLVAWSVGSIRRLAPEGSARRRRQAEDEQLHGVRPDESRERVEQVLRALARRCVEGPLVLRSDEKSSYATIVAAVFGERAVHETTPGTLVRTTHNPLFAINTTIAMTRDNCGRLRRKSWLVTKKAVRLHRHLALFAVYRNYVRRRFNRDAPDVCAAKLLGLLPRSLRWREAIRWRQDWGERSIHPLSRDAKATVAAPVLQAA